jgi:hypothetical protein
MGDFDQALNQNIFGLTTSSVLAITFLMPKIGEKISLLVEVVRNRMGNLGFIFGISGLFTLLWLWNLTRWN